MRSRGRGCCQWSLKSALASRPGPIATPMQDQVLDEEAKRMFESVIPRGKMGRPEEIASVALFLASDDSSYINAVELMVDGGLTGAPFGGPVLRG